MGNLRPSRDYLVSHTCASGGLRLRNFAMVPWVIHATVRGIGRRR